MIVVAENDDGTRTVLASALARSGYDVASVTDGQLVLSTLASGKVGLLILDLRMPGIRRSRMSSPTLPLARVERTSCPSVTDATS